MRRCDCGGAADAVALVREGTWDVLLGRRTDALCAQCGRRFSVHDVLGLVSASVAALVLIAAGSLVVLHPPGGAERSNQDFGVAMIVFGFIAALVFTRRLRLRAKHPLGASGSANRG